MLHSLSLNFLVCKMDITTMACKIKSDEICKAFCKVLALKFLISDGGQCCSSSGSRRIVVAVVGREGKVGVFSC